MKRHHPTLRTSKRREIAAYFSAGRLQVTCSRPSMSFPTAIILDDRPVRPWHGGAEFSVGLLRVLDGAIAKLKRGTDPDLNAGGPLLVAQLAPQLSVRLTWLPILLFCYTIATMEERIAVNPNVHFGKPCVAGTRITVQNVLELVREGVPFDQIVRDFYPDLDSQDIRACIQYAIDVLAAEDIHLATAP